MTTSNEAEQASTASDVFDDKRNSGPFYDESEESEQSSVSEDTPDNIENSENFFRKLQEANNIAKAAYKEIMTIAVEAKAWVVATPALGKLEELQQMFQNPPPPGMRVKCSIQSAVVPISLDFLVRMMMNAERWALSLSHVVSRAYGHVPPGVLRKLRSTDETIKSVLMVNTECHLPTPLVPTWKFCFLRCLRQIIPDVWAIVDLSIDYFPGVFGDVNVFGSETMCRRRPSGLIVRRCGNHSQVIWIENMEVPEGQSNDGIYSGMVNSNLAFSAQRWVDTLIWRLKRIGSRNIELKMQVNPKVDNLLLDLTDDMREDFIDIVSATPDEGKWVTLSNKDVRIVRKIVSGTPDHVDSSGLNNYIAVTSFRLQAIPISVIDILVKKNMDIQWPRLLNAEEPEEVIRFASEDGSNCITLHKKVVFKDKTEQDLEYLLQEASRDGFCSFVISTPMSQLDVNTALLIGNPAEVSLQLSGFAIMPDGHDSLHSDASLITVAIQQQLNVQESDQAIAIMCDLINAVIKDVKKLAEGATHQAEL